MDLKIFGGRSNERLARDIVKYITDSKGKFLSKHGRGDFELGLLDRKKEFPDGELYVPMFLSSSQLISRRKISENFA